MKPPSYSRINTVLIRRLGALTVNIIDVWIRERLLLWQYLTPSSYVMGEGRAGDKGEGKISFS